MRLFFVIITSALLTLPAVAFAANLSAFPASVALKTGDEVQFTLLISSQNQINTVGTAIVLLPGLTFLSASDGSVITQWLEHPSYDKKSNSITFSGIIPNGWTGDGTLATVKVVALKAGTYSLAFDPAQTEIYKNDGNATPEPVAFGTVSNAGKMALYTTLALLFIMIVFVLIRRKYKIIFV